MTLEKKEMDKNVSRVCNKHLQRAETGLKKYGVDTNRDDLTDYEWLNHLQEELMDACVYTERLLQNQKSKANESTIQAFLRKHGSELSDCTVETIVRMFVKFIDEIEN